MPPNYIHQVPTDKVLCRSFPQSPPCHVSQRNGQVWAPQSLGPVGNKHQDKGFWHWNLETPWNTSFWNMVLWISRGLCRSGHEARAERTTDSTASAGPEWSVNWILSPVWLVNQMDTTTELKANLPTSSWVWPTSRKHSDTCLKYPPWTRAIAHFAIPTFRHSLGALSPCSHNLITL